MAFVALEHCGQQSVEALELLSYSVSQGAVGEEKRRERIPGVMGAPRAQLPPCPEPCLPHESARQVCVCVGAGQLQVGSALKSSAHTWLLPTELPQLHFHLLHLGNERRGGGSPEAVHAGITPEAPEQWVNR